MHRFNRDAVTAPAFVYVTLRRSYCFKAAGRAAELFRLTDGDSTRCTFGERNVERYLRDSFGIERDSEI